MNETQKKMDSINRKQKTRIPGPVGVEKKQRKPRRGYNQCYKRLPDAEIPPVFCKRKKGILAKAYQLHRLTGAQCFVIIRNPNGAQYIGMTTDFKEILKTMNIVDDAAHANLISDRIALVDEGDDYYECAKWLAKYIRLKSKDDLISEGEPERSAWFRERMDFLSRIRDLSSKPTQSVITESDKPWETNERFWTDEDLEKYICNGKTCKK